MRLVAWLQLRLQGAPPVSEFARSPIANPTLDALRRKMTTRRLRSALWSKVGKPFVHLP